MADNTAATLKLLCACFQARGLPATSSVAVAALSTPRYELMCPIRAQPSGCDVPCFGFTKLAISQSCPLSLVNPGVALSLPRTT